jgi:hypothetical protein
MIKILLLGEFSSLHLNLYHQLLHDETVNVSLIGSANGFRNLPVRTHYPIQTNNRLLNILLILLTPLVLLPRYLFHDIVQIAGPEHFHPIINRTMMFFICNLNRKIIYLSSGCDPILNYYLENQASRSVSQVCVDCKTFDHNRASICPTNTRVSFGPNLHYILGASDVIAPMQYEYWSAYSFSGYHQKTIHPLPLPWSALSFLPEYSPPTTPSALEAFSETICLSSLKICHAPTRYGFKGTRIVEEYNSIVEGTSMPHIDILPRLDFTSYLKRLEDYDVIVDQLFFESYGYGALLGLYLNKLVLTSTSHRALKSIGYNGPTPFISTLSTAECLFDTLATSINVVAYRQTAEKFLGWHSSQSKSRFLHLYHTIARQ